MYWRVIRCGKSFPGIEEGQACGCDMTANCLGDCNPGLECVFDDETLGHGTCMTEKSNWDKSFCFDKYLDVANLFQA